MGIDVDEPDVLVATRGPHCDAPLAWMVGRRRRLVRRAPRSGRRPAEPAAARQCFAEVGLTGTFWAL